MPSTAVEPQVKQSNLIPWSAFVLFVFSALMLFLVPAFIIRPFRAQSPDSLFLAINIRQLAPVWGPLFAAAALICAVALWRRVRWSGKILLSTGLIFAAAAATMARVNYFEWMFHPDPAPGFESSQSAKLDDGEMVMAVRFGADARAYPIRAMAYHHVVNDVVNGVPIVVTY